MKTIRFIRIATGTLAAAASVLCIWQHDRLVGSQQDIQRLQTEVAQLPALQSELARLRQVTVDPDEVARLRQRQQDDQRELLRLRAKAGTAHRAESEAANLRAELERQTAEATGASNSLVGPMADLMQSGLQQMSQRRVARMQERLNLSPAQTQAIQDILARKAQTMGEATRGVLSGKLDPDKLAALREKRGDPEADIRAVLSPEQQSAYATLQEEEKLNSARLSANSEVLQMQHTIGLTDDQTDSVFAVLYEQSLALHHAAATEPEPLNPAEAEEQAINRKLEALAGVLTPAQLADYRQQQERQLAFLQRLISRADPKPAQP